MLRSGNHQPQPNNEAYELQSRESIDSYGLSSFVNEDHEDYDSLRKRYPSVASFQPLFPQSSQLGTNERQFLGWRVGVAACAMGAFIALLLNVSITVATAIKVGMSNGIGTLFHGNCREVEYLNFWIHLVINALSTVLLSGSNYCMQCLSAPTRDEVNSAHAQGKWLDIGVLSVRNLRSIARRRAFLWWILGLSSVPLHLMYNSAVFSTLASNKYEILFVSKDFASTPQWTNEDLLLLVPSDCGQSSDMSCLDDSTTGFNISFIQQIQKESPNYVELSPSHCISAYSTDFQSTRRNVILITTRSSSQNGTLIGAYPSYVAVNGDKTPYSWMCNSTFINHSSPPCETMISKVAAAADDWEPFDLGLKVERCLSEPVSEACSLQFSLLIISVVIVCNFVKTLIMAVTAFKLVWSPLITIGDGIASFIADPDEHTKGLCLTFARKAKQLERRTIPRDSLNATFYSSMPWKVERVRWAQSASPRRWVLSYTLCIVNLGVCAGLLVYGLHCINGDNSTQNLSSLWKLGFGSVNQLTMLNWSLPSRGTAGILANTIVANLPQAVLSFLYLTFNGLCTCMFLAKEWSQFAHTRKTLRVSMPTKPQRSTFFLELPYRYAVPFLLISGTLHWFVSQSIFLANIDAYDMYGARDELDSFSTCGYSPISMVFVIILGSILLLVGAALGEKTLNPGMPLAASCSAAISAACHVPKDELELHPELRPLQWGVIPGMVDEKGNAHCSFSSREVLEPMDDGTLYTGI